MSTALGTMICLLGAGVLVGFGADWGDFGCFWLGMIVMLMAIMVDDDD